MNSSSTRISAAKPYRCPKWIYLLCVISVAFWTTVSLFEGYFTTKKMKAIQSEAMKFGEEQYHAASEVLDLVSPKENYESPAAENRIVSEKDTGTRTPMNSTPIAIDLMEANDGAESTVEDHINEKRKKKRKSTESTKRTSNGITPENSKSFAPPTNGTSKRFYHDFSYDREAWNQNGGPRIVLMAGPHKTASSTLQEFIFTIAGLTVPVTKKGETTRLALATESDNATESDTTAARRFLEVHSPQASSNNITEWVWPLGVPTIRANLAVENTEKKLDRIQPHPSNTEWVFPVGVRDEYEERDSLGGGMHYFKSLYKFYSNVGAFVSGRRAYWYFKDREFLDIDPCLAEHGRCEPYSNMTQAERADETAKTAEYFRRLVRRPWEDGKNIVLGAESFDTLVYKLGMEEPRKKGEEIHVDPYSSDIIDRLLGLLPWENTIRTPALEIEDIEVQINLRTPRIKHIISIWHQNGHRRTLRQFLKHVTNQFYKSDSLALALQFVRKGIKTTIIDMAGVTHWESERKHDSTVIGGLRAVLACEILRMGKNDGLCDSEGQLHLPGWNETVKDMNKKCDSNSRDLTDEELERINHLLEQYDCVIWKHLQKYQAKGLLRILHPSKDLFSTCNPEGTEDISRFVVQEQLEWIAANSEGLEESDCVDDPTFTFSVRGKTRNCEWLKENKNTCRRKPEAASHCRKTCKTCHCSSLPSKVEGKLKDQFEKII